MTSTCLSNSGIKVTIADVQKWQQFYPKTEMIVTKRRGRVIFPHLNYKIEGLEANTLYHVHIHLERVDAIKYKFDQAEWKEAGKGDPFLPIRHMEHPDGARPGEHWMKDTVSFSHLKMTNDPKNGDAKLVLVQSMHKYQPVLTVLRHGDFRGEEFRLSITQFVVVTAYQSEEMIALKVAHNKFASGFRSNGRKRHSTDSEEDASLPKRSPSPLSISPNSATNSTSNSPPSASWNQQFFPNFQNPMLPNFQAPPFMNFPTTAYFGGYYGMQWNSYDWTGNGMNMHAPNGYQNL